MAVDDLAIVYRDPRDLVGYLKNTRTHTPEQVALIRRSIDEFGFTNPILLKDDQTTIGAGHARLLAALADPPLARVPTVVLAGLSDAQWRAYVIADNRLAEVGSGWDFETLKLELGDLQVAGFDLALTGFSSPDLQGIGFGLPGGQSGGEPGGAGSLAERFGVPPFTVLNAREGWWQDRKRAWIALGIKSELGRGEGATYDTPEITTPGLNHYRDTEKARAFHDGAIKGQGGLADQVAAAATRRRKATAATGGSPEPLARARAGKQSVMRGGTPAVREKV